MQLTVRNGRGEVFLPLQIRLEEVRYGPELAEIARREAPDAFVDGPIWCVFIMFASALEAPDPQERGTS
jgi:hypothetical protein